MSKDIAVRPDILDLIPIEEIKRQMKYFEQVKTELLSRDDMQAIAGKQFVKRSGWRKVALAFALSDRIVSEKRTDRADGSFVWHIIVEVSSQTGRTSTGSGACDSAERKPKEPGKSPWAHVEHDVYATAHTRAKNRAISDMVAAGALSAEEMEAPTITAIDAEEDDMEPAGDITLEGELAIANLNPDELIITVTGNQCVIEQKKKWIDNWSEYNEFLKAKGFKYLKEKKQWVRG